jgi:hypothetical protein
LLKKTHDTRDDGVICREAGTVVVEGYISVEGDELDVSGVDETL